MGIPSSMHHVERLDPTRGYSRERVPLGGRALLAGTFAFAAAGAVLAARRAGVQVPERFHPVDVATVGIATFKLSRIISKGRVTSFARAPFTEVRESAGRGEVEEAARGSGLRRAVGELVVCPYCIGAWIGAVFTTGLVVAPRATRAVSAGLTVVALADVLHLADRAATAAVSGGR
jgi:hypothetical protein